MEASLYANTVMLLLVMDPLGNIPFFIAGLKNTPAARRKYIVLRECFIALLTLLFFLFFGKYLLGVMDLSHAALNISGGVILFLIALSMIFPKNTQLDDDNLQEEPFIVPLAIPLVAGPSSMALVMLIAEQHQSHTIPTLTVFIAWAITTVTLYFGESLSRILSKKGIIALERLMGMILTTISIQMLLNGIREFFGL
jgi:multiple antibiotic resistance protein